MKPSSRGENTVHDEDMIFEEPNYNDDDDDDTGEVFPNLPEEVFEDPGGESADVCS